MRLLHSSDWHIGMTMEGYSYRKDQEYFISQICEIIKNEKIDALLLAGDIFDRKNVSGESIALYSDAMNRICGELKVPVFLIAGNHDSAEQIAVCDKLLGSSGLYVSGILRRDVFMKAYEDTEIYLLPWISTDIVKYVYSEQADEVDSLMSAYRIVCDKIRREWDPDKKHIIVSHAFITKAETSESDRAAVVGLATQVGASVFEGFDYVALGHIHKPQDIGENIRYSGTPMPYSFGAEETQEKSVTIIDTCNMERTIVKLKLLHERNTICGTLDEILSAKYDERVQKGFVKAVVSGSYMSVDMYARLREKFPNLLEAKGESLDSGNGMVSMTLEDFHEKENDPMEIFRQFCSDDGGFVSEEIYSLFEKAVLEVNNSEEND